MNKKIVLILLLVLTLSLTLAACEQHQHEFSDEWTYDKDNHWHKAICGDTDEVSGTAKHHMVGVPGDTRLECDVCGYFENPVTPTPDPEPHKHTFASTLSSDENGHWYEATCEHTEAVEVIAHSYVDGVCSACGWWSSATEVLIANISKSDIWDYTVSFKDVKLDVVNLLSEGIDHPQITVSGELSLNMLPDGQLEGCACVEASGQTYKAVLSQGTVYVIGEDFYGRYGLDELLQQNGINIQAYIDELNANTQQIRQSVTELRQIIDEFPADGQIGEILTSLVKSDETKSNADISVYYIDTELLRTLNSMLATTTVSEYVNGLLAELQGTPLGVLLGDDINGLPNKVYSLLKRTILQTMTDLRLENFTVDDLIDQINGIITNYYPDKNVTTIDELLVALGIDLAEIAKPLGVNLQGVTVKQLLEVCSMMSPEFLWNSFQKDETAKISAVEIKDTLTALIQTYGDKTLYEVALENNAELTAEQLYAYVDAIADWLDNNTSAEFYVDNEGRLQQIAVAVEGQTVALKYNGELKHSYSDIIEQVNGYFDSLESSVG